MTKSLNCADALTTTLARLSVDSQSELTPLVQRVIGLARILQERGAILQSPQERRQQRELERMMQEPRDRATLMQLTDQAFRSLTPRRVANQLVHILDVQGIPRFFSLFDRAMLRGFQSFGAHLPGVSVPMVKSKMREETANVVLPAEREHLREHLRKRNASGLRMNVNYLGEALLGEKEARRRLKTYLAALQMPEIDCISVKISTLYSQISSIAHDNAVSILCDRMELLYRACAKASFERPDGTTAPKFVYLDMEEYRDLRITAEVFMRTLDRSGLQNINAGIALQAYLPDSYNVLREITQWSRRRIEKGGGPVTVRIVKGANMEAERVEASIAGWPQAPYQVKADTDANYKKMLSYALEPAHAAAVFVGVASHNLFDICYALVMSSERDVGEYVQFEMLEGIANHQRRAIAELVSNLLLYAPATKKEDFVNAIGYLIRRLDENTGPDNFLRHAFSLEVGSDTWHQLKEDFAVSCARFDEISSAPRRTQDRRSEARLPCPTIPNTSEFQNEADSDFSLEGNRLWAQEHMHNWAQRHGAKATDIPLVIGGEEIFRSGSQSALYDPSCPNRVVANYLKASAEDIDAAIQCARADPRAWRDMQESARTDLLAQVAQELRRARGDLMGAAMVDAGKTFAESDPEVSEAIDFVVYYAATARDFRSMSSVETEPVGVVVVVPPWNFPIAIPCGGIAAALAAGNTVILKPASLAVLVAYELCKCFWRAGIPREVLQFLPCAGSGGGARLVRSEEVDVVILTGGTDTAMCMQKARPSLNLLAETGGKNATIVTAMSDREQAIKHVLASAFGHAGQKCSATSLLILEAEVYDDLNFRETLCDAARSIEVGSAHSLSTRMGPLICAPAGDLERALKELETGESWALMPKRDRHNPNLWTPAVKWDVQEGSYTHMTEFFGPMLGVMRAQNLNHAIELVNQTGYGLTSGLESLDEREQEQWREQILAGNLYINRPTTGAIVLRQPFGGVGKSAFGPGIKAGGPNYVTQLMRFVDSPQGCGLGAEIREPAEHWNPDVATLARALAEISEEEEEEETRPANTLVNRNEVRRILRIIPSYVAAWESEFGISHDRACLIGQDNLRRYLAVGALRIRVHAEDSPVEVFARVCAAAIARCRITLSIPPNFESPAIALLDRVTDSWGAAIEFVEESDTQLAEAIDMGQVDRLRYAARGRAPSSVIKAASLAGIYVATAPVLQEGRLEILWYVREQSISHDYHRYGNLGARVDEVRAPLL